LKTSEGTEETSSSLSSLNELANELQRSVSGFKLPSQSSGKVETVVLDS